MAGAASAVLLEDGKKNVKENYNLNTTPLRLRARVQVSKFLKVQRCGAIEFGISFNDSRGDQPHYRVLVSDL